MLAHVLCDRIWWFKWKWIDIAQIFFYFECWKSSERKIALKCLVISWNEQLIRAECKVCFCVIYLLLDSSFLKPHRPIFITKRILRIDCVSEWFQEIILIYVSVIEYRSKGCMFNDSDEKWFESNDTYEWEWLVLAPKWRSMWLVTKRLNRQIGLPKKR